MISRLQPPQPCTTRWPRAGLPLVLAWCACLNGAIAGEANPASSMRLVNTSAAAASRRIDCPPAYVPRPMSQVQISLAPSEGELPVDCAVGKFSDADRRPAMFQRGFAATMFNWEAVAICHKPLYFEDMPLERYGQTCHPCLQPVVSAAKFYATFPLLPYKMALDRPHQCQYNLGYYRPGSPTPCTTPWLPLELDAAGVEAATVAGVILLFP